MTQTLTTKVSELARNDAETNSDHERQRMNRYVALLTKGDDCTQAETTELYELMRALGYKPSNVQRHLELISQYRDFARYRDDALDARERQAEADELDAEWDRRCTVVNEFEQATVDPTRTIPDEAMNRINEIRKQRGDSDAGLTGLTDHQRDVLLTEVLNEWRQWRDVPHAQAGEIRNQAAEVDRWRAKCDEVRDINPKLIAAYERNGKGE